MQRSLHCRADDDSVTQDARDIVQRCSSTVRRVCQTYSHCYQYKAKYRNTVHNYFRRVRHICNFSATSHVLCDQIYWTATIRVVRVLALVNPVRVIHVTS